MLHDIGKLIFIRNKPEEYKDIYRRQKEEKKPLCVLEMETLEVTHADIGGYLLSTWGLPEEIVKAISLHHNPIYSLQVSFDPLTTVFVANVLAHEEMQDTAYDVEEEIKKGYLTKLELIKYLPEWRKITKLVKEMEEKER